MHFNAAINFAKDQLDDGFMTFSLDILLPLVVLPWNFVLRPNELHFFNVNKIHAKRVPCVEAQKILSGAQVYFKPNAVPRYKRGPLGYTEICQTRL